MSSGKEYEIAYNIISCYKALFKCNTLDEVHQLTKFPKSTASAYLKSELALEILGRERYDAVQARLKQMAINGNRRGGIISESQQERVNGRFGGKKR